MHLPPKTDEREASLNPSPSLGIPAYSVIAHVSTDFSGKAGWSDRSYRTFATVRSATVRHSQGPVGLALQSELGQSPVQMAPE
ncbi:hypothetical protein NU195Hw_Modified_644t1 [Hortaea werneckii]